MKPLIAATVGILLTALPTAAAEAEDSTALKQWKKCEAQVRKDYPVPPGNVNTLKQMIELTCGAKPAK
jgi:hypothetical protein